MMPCNLRSLLLAAVVLSNCITWTASRHHYTHNVSGHRSRHRRQGAGLFLSASYVLPGGEGTGWGEWGEVSPCSRTCGGGVASQRRICLHLGPDGQPQCTGGDTKYFSCQTQDCPAGSKDFREQQCSEFDDQAFRDIKYKWVPYTKAPNPCELNCMPHGERFYYRHRTKVIDGTRCDDESFDVCVNGTCQPVGCDMMLGSTAREDKCRECRGNGANCHTTTGLLDTQDLRKGYNDMLLIPESATTIVIAEIAPSNNYLALRAKNGTYYLNGHYHIDFPRTLVIAGALWTYERSQQGFAAPDKLRCLGPTNEPLYLALLLQDVNVGIDYEYSVPNELAPPRNKRYNWVHDEFTPCSADCGGGYQTRNVSCRSREELELVDEGLCDAEIKPPTNQTCNTERCAPQWSPGSWGKCSKRCGKGGTRSREVHCTQVISNGYPSIVDDKSCFDLLGPKPELFQTCNVNATCPLWFTGPWKPCDKLCDEGKQTRQVVCYQKSGRRVEVLGDEECNDEKPTAEQQCMLEPCEGVDWVVTEWSGCDTCLSTVRSRNIACSTKERKVVNDTFCANHKKPEGQEPCDKTKLPPCEVQWYATQWSKCSVDCGKGIQTRKVFCGLFDGASVLKVDDSRCAGQTKYNDTKECEVPKEKCPSKWHTGPWSACTEKCGGGEQYRRVMCLRSEEPASDCDGEIVPDSTQSCNSGPCNKDGLIPVDNKSSPVLDDYEDCVEEEEEEYPEVGLDSDSSIGATMDDFMSTMFSDSPSEGSGMWSSSVAEHESTFTDTDSTLSSEELLTTESGSGITDTDFTGLDEDSTDTSSSDDTSSTSGYESTTELGSGSTTNETDSTVTEETESTVTDGTDSTESPKPTDADATGETESTVTDVTESTITGETESTVTDETESTITEETESTDTDETESTVTEETEWTVTDETSESGSTESTETDETVTTEVGPSSSSSDSTDTDETETTESGATDDTSAEATSETTESTDSSSLSTDMSGSTETSDGSTVSEITEDTPTTDATSSTDSEGTTESDGTSDTATTESELTSETESTVEGSTEPSSTEQSTESESTTESGSTSSDTEGSSTVSEISTEPIESSSTETTEASSTTESGSTEASETTNVSITEAIETTELGSTETTEVGSTETTEISSTDTTEAGSTITTEVGSTETTEIGSTETTETSNTSEAGSTEGTETTETGSTEPSVSTDTSEAGSTETTEFGSTEITTTSETGSTETAALDTGSTVSTLTEETTTEVFGSTETTEQGSTVSSEGTESSSESSTTEAASITKGRTPWDLSSTVEVYTTKRVRLCRPRSCFVSEFGCCPDKKTPALGPFDDGCPKPHTCLDSIHGCCPDGLSPAQGRNNKGCPIEPCAETLFGCCESDNKTAAKGNDQEGCPPPPPACKASKYGCCKDGETEATGPEKEGCPETTVPATEETEETEDMSTTTSPTEAVEDCARSEYGCCFDNKMAATGPDRQGCPCNTSQFGCCPDGVATAQGPAFEGCVQNCNSSAYGCCPDNKTPAHGPGHEGCCLLYAFGCCPDNYKPADGPHLEGCGCQHSRFGCCPDNVTLATGPENKGCGCQYTEFGCCPDRHSDASGPDFEGCMCHTYQFGCCPDGVTIARGPSGQGCYCQQSKFGCCGDEQTHAKGPNKEGCDCATSKHGCCLDGTTEATGPKFEGCTDKPENKQAACGLKFERGPCRNYSVNWYYDTEYGGCSRFWYGGCDGNGNRFSSKEECEDTCVSPPPKDACKLPQVKGACLGYNVRWYFDNERDSCTNFIYGGCLGNNNNFETRELCQTQCEPERAVDQCKLGIERGSCSGNYPRWGYTAELRRCVQFIWGGCEGNTNRYHTEAACLLRCNPPGEPQPECSEPQEKGNCTEVEALWSFSQTENRCLPFYYTGCGGNGNKFQNLEDCQEACPSAYVPELCTLPAATGDCSDYREKWYFDTKDQRCRQFYYGGCGGNGNNFVSEQECTARCSSPPATTSAPPASTASTPQPDPDRSEFCFLAIDAGPCNQLEQKWAYDYTKGKCTAFQYGGCGGNQNNFPTEEHCTYYCKPTQDICQLPMLSGPCDDSVMSWFYDASSDSCSQFTYGGCEGNDNRFDSREDCENRCKTGPVSSSTTPPSTTTVTVASEVLPPNCTISPELEQCSPDSLGEVWYFDPASSACTAHENTDSGVECRISGSFYSQEACERSCGAFRNIDVCKYRADPGPCRDYVPKYHYNVTSRRCEEFAYGGCLGGPNRYSTEQECELVCMTAVDPCTLPPEPGNCVDRIELWYYDQRTDLCNQFAYGGCGGNENKFDTRDVCESRCRKQPPALVTTTTPLPLQTTRQPQPEEECRTPNSLEPCGRNITTFYFDERTRSCQVADIGGCNHPNSYRSEEECERRCGEFRGIDVCRARLDAGPCRASIPKFYFDAASGSCREYAYGGCNGGPNRFSTSEECEEICSGAGPARECLQDVAVGSRCAAVPERRWHYDVVRVDCLVFAYQGCGGNENNFLSYEECAAVCRVNPTEPVDSQVCDQYAEECSFLESTCVYGVVKDVAAEGCERCACADPPDCEPQRRECDALRCAYGVQRSRTDDGCEKCRCYEDPCRRNNCTSNERCVIASDRRDPTTQERLYSAHCVPVKETNEVLPDCDTFINECARISCPRGYSVHRTRTADGCESCSCEHVQVDCTQLRAHCDGLKCQYGLARAMDMDGCERCHCLDHPCSAKVCPAGTRCVATPFRDPVTQEPRYSADCRTVNKEGECPASAGMSGRSTEVTCRHECNDDADCRGVLKCCSHGCSNLCLAPALTTTTLPPTTYLTTRPSVMPQAPQASAETEPEVSATEGGNATLRCIFHGNPPPKVTWHFGEITIDDNQGRYRLTSDGALQIISLDRTDSGVYICVAENELGRAQQEVTLNVDGRPQAPQASPETEPEISATEGGNATLRCIFHGNPPPKVSWHFGEITIDDNQGRYRLTSDGALQIISLDRTDSGVYICVAENELGRAQQEVTLNVDAIPQAPKVSPETKPEISATEGGIATLRCIFHGNPPPKVTWRFGEITIDGDRDRYRLLSDGALEIVALYRNDSGVYICVAENELGRAQQEVTLNVNDPVSTAAGIAGEPGATFTGELDQPLAVRCLAYGFPIPTIYWYRGHLGPMVPFSSVLYEYGHQELLIRRLGPDTLGEYECEAYNGVGKPVTRRIVVQAYRPDGYYDPGNPYLVPRGETVVAVTPRAPTTTLTTLTTPQQEIFIPPFTVPVETKLLPSSTTLSAGAQLDLPCEVDGYPEPAVHWTKDNVLLAPSDRVWITTTRLTIPHVLVNDSGEYGCHAANEYSSHSSVVQISVQELYIPAKCVDNPTFANCALIVQSRFCMHKYYSRFCCKSCVEAGQLDVREVEMQADEPFKKK